MNARTSAMVTITTAANGLLVTYQRLIANMDPPRHTQSPFVICFSPQTNANVATAKHIRATVIETYTDGPAPEMNCALPTMLLMSPQPSQVKTCGFVVPRKIFRK